MLITCRRLPLLPKKYLIENNIIRVLLIIQVNYLKLYTYKSVFNNKLIISKRKYNQIERDVYIEKIPNRTRNKRGKKGESKDSERTVALTTKNKRTTFYKKELEKKQRLKKVEENSIDPDEERILGNSHSSTDSDQEVKTHDLILIRVVA